MESVGFFGTIKFTKQIILKNFKPFLCILSLLIIPACALYLPVQFDLSFFTLEILAGLMFLLISSKYKQYIPPSTELEEDPQLSHSIIVLILFIIIPLVASPPLTVTVYRACLNKSLDLKASLWSIPRCAKNLVLTSISVIAVLFGLVAMSIGIVGITGGVLQAVRPDIASMAVACTCVVMGICGVYLTITFSLAHTVAMLEEKKGWGAMKRSMYLLDDRKWLALGLAVLFSGILIPTEAGYVFPILTSIEASVLWRWRGGSIVQVSLQAFTVLFSMVAYVVLYVSCKSRREEEPLHTLMAASSHQFGPHESLPKSMDLETSPFVTAL